MIVTNVLASHYPESYVHQLMAAFNRGLAEHTSDVVTYDLYDRQFDPVMHGADFNQFLGGDLPEEIRAYQQRLRCSDVLTCFYPVWWNDMPAILKGWVDRVFSKGFAYELDEQGERGLLTIKRVVLVCTLGNSGEEASHQRLEEAMRTKEQLGVFGYCGVPQVEHHFLHNVYAAQSTRERYLDEIQALGRDLNKEENT